MRRDKERSLTYRACGMHEGRDAEGEERRRGDAERRGEGERILREYGKRR
jgi:hypothetical protein